MSQTWYFNNTLTTPTWTEKNVNFYINSDGEIYNCIAIKFMNSAGIIHINVVIDDFDEITVYRYEPHPTPGWLVQQFRTWVFNTAVTDIELLNWLNENATIKTGINKVEYTENGVVKSLIDLTSDTVTAADVRQGVTFHLPNGEQTVGTLVI